MSRVINRRTALRGSIAASLGLMAGVAPAAARPAPSMSAEAITLHAEFRSVVGAYKAASARLEQTEETLTYPEAPKALFARSGDSSRLGFRSPVKSWVDGRRWYGDPDKIEDLRAAPFRYMSGRIDQDAIARRDEIVSAWDTWQAAMKAAEDVCGYTEAYKAWDAAQDAYHDFRERLTNLRATDADIMALKAQVALERAGGIDGIDDMLTATLAAAGMQQEAMAMSLVRDFIVMLGAAHREAARV